MKNARLKKDAAPEKEELAEKVVNLTGLPKQAISTELKKILEGAGHQTEGLTIDQLRYAMMTYLEMMNAEMMARQADEEKDQSN